MHWLADRVSDLTALSDALDDHRRRREAGAPVGRDEARARIRFLDALQELVDEVAQRDGVLACVAAHDGLLVSAAGDADGEALAAMGQWCLMPARSAAETLELGSVRQLLLVGDDRKLALVQIGAMTLGVLSPSEVRLADATAV